MASFDDFVRAAQLPVQKAPEKSRVIAVKPGARLATGGKAVIRPAAQTPFGPIAAAPDAGRKELFVETGGVITVDPSEYNYVSMISSSNIAIVNFSVPSGKKPLYRFLRVGCDVSLRSDSGVPVMRMVFEYTYSMNIFANTAGASGARQFRVVDDVEIAFVRGIASDDAVLEGYGLLYGNEFAAIETISSQSDGVIFTPSGATSIFSQAYSNTPFQDIRDAVFSSLISEGTLTNSMTYLNIIFGARSVQTDVYYDSDLEGGVRTTPGGPIVLLTKGQKTLSASRSAPDMTAGITSESRTYRPF